MNRFLQKKVAGQDSEMGAGLIFFIKKWVNMMHD